MYVLVILVQLLLGFLVLRRLIADSLGEKKYQLRCAIETRDCLRANKCEDKFLDSHIEALEKSIKNQRGRWLLGKNSHSIFDSLLTPQEDPDRILTKVMFSVRNLKLKPDFWKSK